MDKALEKITKYDFLVNIVQGGAAVLVLNLVFKIETLTGNVIVDLIAIYFYGILSELIGNLFECILISAEIYEKIDYKKYSSLEGKDYRVRIISRKISMYKAIAGASILVIVLLFLNKNINYSLKPCCILVIFTFLMIIIIYNIKHQKKFLDERLKKQIH